LDGVTLSSTHFAVLTSPVPGHLNPVQVLGAELVRRGARVTIVHVDGVARFQTEPSVRFATLPASISRNASLDAYLGMLARPRGIVGLPRMIQATARMTDALLEGAPQVLRSIGATAVIADAVEPAGPLVAEQLGLPHLVTVTGLPLIAEEDVPPPFLGWHYRPDALGRFRNRGGYAVSDRLLRPIDRVLHRRREAWRLPAVTTPPLIEVAQCPRGLDYPRSALPSTFRYGAPWRRHEDVELVLPDDRPLVFCSLGTLQGARLRLIAAMSAACAAIGARAVIAHAGGLSPAQIARIPGDPLVRSLWPQTAILRRCSAAMLHGGFNTVLDALAAELPMVLLPIAFEQPGTAARVARLGAGKVLSPRWPTVRELSRALAEVLQRPSYRQATSLIAAEMKAHGGVTAAADSIVGALAR
jgi:MGT family glycosyltransferase